MLAQLRSAAIKVLLLALISVIVVFSLLSPAPAAQADDGRALLQAALQRIETKPFGKILHYTYVYYNRPPPSELEPADPYHLPYAQLWASKEFLERWVEIDEEGMTRRWRTQLRNAEGELLQDLLFDGEMETDYYVQDRHAIRFPLEDERMAFRDERVALIEDVLQNASLPRREAVGLDGRPVVSVYSHILDLRSSAWAKMSVEEALLSFVPPFVADLKPVRSAGRVDFDPVTLLPIGEAEVVWDAVGVEHIVRYRTFGEPVEAPPEQAETIFRQEIPPEAFEGRALLPVHSRIVGVKQLPELASYPVYALPEGTNNWRSAIAAFGDAELKLPLPQFMRMLDPVIVTEGIGVTLSYRNLKTSATLYVVQAEFSAMGAVLRQLAPSWTRAEQVALALGPDRFPAWALTERENNRVRYIIETPETLLYIDGSDVAAEEVVELLAQFVRLAR